jgi:hypothetical protein
VACGNKERGKRYRGAANPNWQNGYTEANGYIYRRVRLGSGGAGQAYRAEHHIVWEEAHGQSLPGGWVVHHLNGIKDDNRPENLAAMSRHEHHKHPREALRPYEERIRLLEEQVRKLGG